MARDRKRSKGRGKRTPGTSGDPDNSPARDLGIDDPGIDASGATDPVPAPDPLKNASADVDIARAAEAGAEPPSNSDEEFLDDDFERAPDEVQGDQQRSGHDPELEGVPGRPRKERGKVLTFLRNCWEELQRVQWPDRRHTGQATAVTLGFVVVAGAFLGLMDAIWKPIIQAII